MTAAPHRVPDVPGSPRRDRLRALVDLASGAASGPAEAFPLPNGPREAVALLAGGAREVARGAGDAAGRLLAAAAIVAWALLSLPLLLAGAPLAAALPGFFVACVWVAADGLVRAEASSGAFARLRSRSVPLYRDDSKQIARRAVAAAAGLSGMSAPGRDAAFDGYHRALLSLARFELAAGQAAAAERDRSRLAPGDPLRPVAGQIAQDRAARAVEHRTAARQEVEVLESRLRLHRDGPSTF